MKDEPNEIIFETTGRRAYANNGIIGIDRHGVVSDGYDGSFIEYDNPTKEEKKELALFMIERWKKYGNLEIIDEQRRLT